LAVAALLFSVLLLVLPARWFPGSDDLLMFMPGLRRLYRNINYCRLVRLLGLLLEVQTPLPEALRLVAGGLPSARLARQCHKAASLAEGGRPVAESLQGAGLGPVAVALGMPERLPAHPRETFSAASQWFETRARTGVQMIELFYPPVAFVSLWLVFSIMIPAVYLPLIRLISDLA